VVRNPILNKRAIHPPTAKSTMANIISPDCCDILFSLVKCRETRTFINNTVIQRFVWRLLMLWKSRTRPTKKRQM